MRTSKFPCPCPAVSPCRPIFPCRMPPYSHADIPFKFFHRNSGGPANVSILGQLQISLCQERRRGC